MAEYEIHAERSPLLPIIRVPRTLPENVNIFDQLPIKFVIPYLLHQHPQLITLFDLQEGMVVSSGRPFLPKGMLLFLKSLALGGGKENYIMENKFHIEKHLGPRVQLTDFIEGCEEVHPDFKLALSSVSNVNGYFHKTFDSSKMFPSKLDTYGTVLPSREIDSWASFATRHSR